MRFLHFIVAVLVAVLVAPVAQGQAQVPSIKVTRIAEFADGLSRPHDAALSPDGRLLYLTDMQNSRIRVFEAMSLKPVGTFGERELAYPHDITFDAAGRLLVADTGNDRIAIYRVKGAAATLSGEVRGIPGTEGVAVLPDGRIVATSTRAANLSLIEGDRIERSVGRYGKADGELANPHDVEVDAEGRIHVVDSGNNRVQVFDSQLRHLSSTPAALGLNGPKYLAFDGATVWLADEYNHRILRLDRSLKATGVLGGKSGRGDDAFNQPEAVVARAPYLWVIDTYNDRIVLLKVD
jgi:DNA-binding beta-propeller fold protein YncE